MSWQPIDGYEGKYEVSDCGGVRRIGGLTVGQWANCHSYLIVRLSRPRAQYRVHRLVARAFIPNPQNLPFINHLDSNRQNNSAANLEWCTQKHNLAHASALGRMPRDYWAGKRSPNAILSDDQISEIRSLYEGGQYSWANLGKRFCISKRSVGRIIARESYADV